MDSNHRSPDYEPGGLTSSLPRLNIFVFGFTSSSFYARYRCATSA